MLPALWLGQHLHQADFATPNRKATLEHAADTHTHTRMSGYMTYLSCLMR